MRNGLASAPALETLEELARSGSFEASMLGLEQVVSRLEEGQLAIDEAVKWYEIGLALSHRCAELLKQVELQIRVLETKYDFDQLEDLDDLESDD